MLASLSFGLPSDAQTTQADQATQYSAVGMVALAVCFGAAGYGISRLLCCCLRGECGGDGDIDSGVAEGFGGLFRCGTSATLAGVRVVEENCSAHGVDWYGICCGGFNLSEFLVGGASRRGRLLHVRLAG